MSKQPSAPKQKWVGKTHGTGAAPPQSSPLTPAHPSGFEDSAVNDYARKHHTHAAPNAPEVATTQYYDRQEGSDALSNLFHNNLEEEAIYTPEAGVKKIQEYRTPQLFHAALMPHVKSQK